MSQNNNDNGAAMGIVLVGAMCAFMFMIIYAIACFLAIVVTLASLAAWNKPLTIGKKTLVTPRDARVFIGCGLLGFVALPVFVMMCVVLFKFNIRPDYWDHIFIAGYCFGMVGLGSYLVEQEEKEAIANQLLLQQQQRANTRAMSPVTYASPQAKEAQPFRFASWEDEMPNDEDKRR